MRRLIFIFILILFLLMAVVETIMIIRYGIPLPEPDPPQFRYQQVDIYKRFFKKVSRGNQDAYIPQRARNNCIEFVAVKAPDTIRIFIIGDSAAYNFGFFPFGDILKGLIPDRNFEVICCGMGAYDSYRVYLVEKEILSYNPDLIIVFSGNNEFYNKIRVNLWDYYINKLLRRAWCYRSLQNLFIRKGLLRFEPFSRDREQRLTDYEKHIRLIVRDAKAKGVPVILCTLPVNFRDCPPGAESPMDIQYLTARSLLEDGRYPSTINKLRNFLKDNPDNPLGFYFLAKAYEGMRNFQKAKESYLQALELCYGDGRASPKSNGIIRRICAEENMALADLESAFINVAPHGLLGREQFSDNCHWYLEYNSLVAEVIIRALSLYSDAIGFSKHKLEAFYLAHHFPSLKERGKRKDELEGRIKAAVWEVLRFNDGLCERAISCFETIYLMDANSLWNLRFLKDRLKKMYAEDFWVNEVQISNFERNWPSVLYHIGETYRRLGLYRKSLQYFKRAITLDDSNYLPYIGRALTYNKLGNRQRSAENINRAERISDNLEAKYYKEILGL